MFFEITLIQKLTLFLGYPTYSLTVTLASILVFTGVGALLSDRLSLQTWRAALPLLGAMVALTALLPVRAAGRSPTRCSSCRWPRRIVVAFLLLAPLGVCLGMFMPLGLTAVVAGSPPTRASTWRGAGRSTASPRWSARCSPRCWR